jgi:hypothetical protein
MRKDVRFSFQGICMTHNSNIHRRAQRASSRLSCMAALVLFVAGCNTIKPSQDAPLPVVLTPVSDFTITAGMLDTWNAVGQILVRTDGATYEGRAQMLGLYDVRYRGERFLVLTRALALTSDRQMTTKVSVALRDGKPDGSDAAIELLGLLRARLPEELRLDASGGRGRKHIPGKKIGNAE